VTSVAAEQFHREHEPDFYRKCECGKRRADECKCEIEDSLPGNDFLDLDEGEEDGD
jgi:hypothetical protein